MSGAVVDAVVVVVVELVDDWSLPLVHPAAISAAIAPAAKNANGLDCMRAHFPTGVRSPLFVVERVSRVFIRYALPRDAERLVADRVVGGPTPSGEPWLLRVQKWLGEQQAGRRLILVAEDASGLLGIVQLVFRFPPGYADSEAANGTDVAMVEALRARTDAPPGVATQLITDVQNIARKRGIKTLTFLLGMNDNRGIAQAKSWGFEEFRIMPEAGRMLAFFRKSIE